MQPNWVIRVAWVYVNIVNLIWNVSILRITSKFYTLVYYCLYVFFVLTMTLLTSKICQRFTCIFDQTVLNLAVPESIYV